MSLPTPAKTWQISHVSNALSGNETADMDDFFNKVKNAAKAFGTNPLTVVGSSNGVSANLSGTDVLASLSDYVHNSPASNHSWIVLEKVDGAQICFDFNHTETNRMDIILSPSAGFSGGTITDRPTATDELVLWANDSWTGMLGNGTSGGQARGHVMLSTDGLCFRVLIANNGVVGGFLLVDKPGSPVTGWTNPEIGTFLGLGRNDNTSDTVLTVASWYGSAKFKARGPVATMPFYPTFESPGNFYTVATKRNAPNEISGEYPMQRVGLWHDDTVGQRGRHGFVFDLWFSNQVLQTGDTFPSGGTKEFIVFSDAVFVGDGTDWATG